MRVSSRVVLATDIPLYLEIEIKKWPSGARWGQIGPNRAKSGQLDQTGPNGTKWGQIGPDGTKWGKQGKIRQSGAKQGKMRQNRVNGGWFYACRHIFMRGKNFYLATKALRQKLAKLWGFCYFLEYYRPSLKALSVFLYSSEEFFFISSESLFIKLYFEPWL